jgi:hypothetical protein
LLHGLRLLGRAPQLKLDMLESERIGDGAAIVGGGSFGPGIAGQRDPLGFVYFLGN